MPLDPCSNHSCQNGGRCIFHGENFKCICIAPFTGTFCEIGKKFFLFPLFWGFQYAINMILLILTALVNIVTIFKISLKNIYGFIYKKIDRKF